ncbi:unnamed protein product, partial [Ascophyllum nodosum]
NSQYSVTTRRSPPKGSGPKSGATNPPAPAPAPSGRFSQLKKQVAEIRDVLEKLRRLSYEIGEIDRRFDAFACTGGTVTKQKWQSCKDRVGSAASVEERTSNQ